MFSCVSLLISSLKRYILTPLQIYSYSEDPPDYKTMKVYINNATYLLAPRHIDSDTYTLTDAYMCVFGVCYR